MEARQGYSWHTEDCMRWALAELWFLISLEQEMNDMEPHTGTSEAEIISTVVPQSSLSGGEPSL